MDLKLDVRIIVDGTYRSVPTHVLNNWRADVIELAEMDPATCTLWPPSPSSRPSLPRALRSRGISARIFETAAGHFMATAGSSSELCTRCWAAFL